MQNKTIAVDCDLVLVNTSSGWFSDLYSKYEIKNNTCMFDARFPYNLTGLFNIPEGEDGYSYWKSSTLYSGLKPIPDSVEVLQELKDKGHNLVVVSRITGDHASSKCKWIKKWYPFIDGIILTGANKKEKSFVRCDYVIDDSLEQLVEFPDDVYKLHYETPYYQVGVEPPKENFVPVRDWKHIKEYFNSLEKE